MPGEGQVPQLALTWELYSVAPAPSEERVDGVLCETVADIVFRRFWVIFLYEIKNQHYLVIVLISVVLFDCRPSTGFQRESRSPRVWLSKTSASAYFKT